MSNEELYAAVKAEKTVRLAAFKAEFSDLVKTLCEKYTVDIIDNIAYARDLEVQPTVTQETSIESISTE
jgi:hypothetical protein